MGHGCGGTCEQNRVDRGRLCTSEENGPQVLADFAAQIDADKKSMELRGARCNSNRNLRISR